jgi:tyrosine-protein kinase Etk/Wzc
MNDTTPAFTTGAPAAQDGKKGEWIDTLITIARFKKLILGMALVTAITASVISLILPEIYTASTKVVPPQQSQSGAAALLSQLGGAAGALAGAGGLKNPAELYIGLLKSRTIADRLIGSFNLRKVYDKPTMEKTRRKLLDNTNIVAGKDSMITIDVEDEDPKRAARIANAYVEELLKLSKTLAVTEASKRRVFYEMQLNTAKDNLANAELKLKESMDVHGVISVDADSRAIVETIARLRAQISNKEIQLSAMSAFITPNNPDYKRIQEELLGLREQLTKLQNGVPGASEGHAADKVGGLENIKTLRDVKYYQMLYELLAKQYEVARLDEAKESPIVQVLDPAIEPEQRTRPKRAIIVAIATVISTLLTIAAVVLLDRKEKMLQEPELAEKWRQLKIQFSST